MSLGLQVRARSQIRRGAVIAAASVFLLTWVGCASTPTANRPETWAQPVTLEGVPNLYRISGELYRGDQPSSQGMRNLKNLGLKTIINLRSFHSDRDEIGDTGLGYEHIYMKAWHPEEKEVVRFLKIVTDPKRAPVLVHCQHGADRTGTMIAVYRIAVQGWSKAEAIREMTEGGFGFHPIWSILPNWIQKLDIDRIKRQAGIKSPTEQ
ncbi:MAG: dual specificity protein phosphatase family protein [Desulfobacterales bacterium]|nr:dual specificity protein phosphatase family protein [Pseudomonadota bacterium]MBU4357237.1 dual specificity protein phosphatase family protein [Pseudomonadota bacterium]MCG2771830.1 dual specificity protein phosphatase family protein [Desulfobacterales bacterium]